MLSASVWVRNQLAPSVIRPQPFRGPRSKEGSQTQGSPSSANGGPAPSRHLGSLGSSQRPWRLCLQYLDAWAQMKKRRPGAHVNGPKHTVQDYRMQRGDSWARTPRVVTPPPRTAVGGSSSVSSQL